MRAIFYHGVADRAERGHYYASMFADRFDFERDVAELARRWHAMSLAEIHDHVAQGLPLPARAVHVSFDDGFSNTLTAAEILARHRVPWTLFVVVDSVVHGYRPWFVRLANALGVASNVRWPDGSVVELSTSAAKRRVAREIKARIMAAPASRHEEVVNALLALPGLPHEPEDRWTLLTRDDVLQLRGAGVEIGNHSARHLNLNRSDTEMLHAEIEDSRRRLEVTLASPVRWFAYPDGRYSRRVAAAAAAGHDLSMSVWRPGATWRETAIPRRPGGIAPLDAPAQRADIRSCIAWARDMAPVKARELRHRLYDSSGIASTGPNPDPTSSDLVGSRPTG